MLRRVDPAGGGTSGKDLFPVRVALGPEGGAPGVVETDQIGIALPQPIAERTSCHIAVAVCVVTAELVVDVPQDKRRMAAEVLGELLDEGQLAMPNDGGARTERLARAWVEPPAVVIDRQDLRIRPAQPGRW